MVELTTSLDARRKEANAREAAENVWRILRYASSQRRPGGWQGYEAEARQYAALLGECSRLAGVESGTATPDDAPEEPRCPVSSSVLRGSVALSRPRQESNLRPTA